MPWTTPESECIQIEAPWDSGLIGFALLIDSFLTQIYLLSNVFMRLLSWVHICVGVCVHTAHTLYSFICTHSLNHSQFSKICIMSTCLYSGTSTVGGAVPSGPGQCGCFSGQAEFMLDLP